MFHRRFFEWERHARLFEKGDLKYVILDLLKDKPSHGYEIIRSLEQRFHGFYSPSAGSIYPTLQLLQDMGYVTSSEQDGKKVYSITDAGKQFLSEREETMDKIRSHMRAWGAAGSRQDFRDTLHEIRNIARLISQKANRLDPEKFTKIKEIITKACQDIEKILETENKS